jgi:hypothetical protein
MGCSYAKNERSSSLQRHIQNLNCQDSSTIQLLESRNNKFGKSKSICQPASKKDVILLSLSLLQISYILLYYIVLLLIIFSLMKAET